MKIQKSLISTLIVTYNAQNYILSTIKSCLNQTYSNFELLILDNASTDNTINIIENLKNPKIKLYKSKENTGPYKGLNFLLDKAKGEYIAIQDHDDLWLPQKLAKQVNYLNKNKDRNACGTRAFIFYESKQILISDNKPEEINYVNHTSLMFRNNGYRYDLNYLLTDEHFEKVILGGNKTKIHCLKDTLSIHRIRGDRHNLSRTRFKFNKKNISEYLSINGLSINTFVNLFGIFVAKYFPPFLEWFIIDKIVKSKSNKISLKNFQKKYPNLL
ncbi:MAG: glycosyltransferase family 2 protein [Candidatus Shapirobacteria bacterium]